MKLSEKQHSWKLYYQHQQKWKVSHRHQKMQKLCHSRRRTHTSTLQDIDYELTFTFSFQIIKFIFQTEQTTRSNRGKKRP